MEYEYYFETDYGLESGLIKAKNRRAAIEELKRMYPNDWGADGFITNENNDQFPINW